MQVVKISPLHVKKMLRKIEDADVVIDLCLEMVKGAENLIPHERTARIIDVKKYIKNLKESW